ncbi:MAG: DnaJ domain-containing protein [Acidobacteriota bacterium]
MAHTSVTTAPSSPPNYQEAPVQGQLGEKLVPDLIRELAMKSSSGLLRLSHGKAIKAVFFDSGAPTFAISNVSNEQLEHKLRAENLVTVEQLERAKEQAGKAHRLGPALVEMGILGDEQMRKLVCEQVMGIIVSIFAWTQGDYSFDERIRTAHEVTLGLTAADALLEGARHAADIPEVAQALVPKDAVVLRPKNNGLRIDTGRLIPLESYVLARIESPTSVTDVGALSGLGETDAHRAVCALVAAGFLKLLDNDKDDDEDPATREAEESLERVREDVIRRLHFSITADYYEVMGVTRHATTAEIKAAYYHLAKKYHPDRYHQSDSELRTKLETLFASLTQAYETLSQPGTRASYDEKIRKPSGSQPHNPSATMPLSEPIASGPRVSEQERPQTGDLKPLNGQPGHVDLPRAQVDSSAGEVISASNVGSQIPPAQRAEHFYQQGRARFERKEYHAAVHLLREAIKLDSSRAPYHYHLGLALIRNPRTRRDAEVHLAKAAELEPYNAQIRVKLGLLYKEAGLAKKAENYFREALQMDPDNRMAKKELGTDGSKTKTSNGSFWKADMGTMAKRIFKK